MKPKDSILWEDILVYLVAMIRILPILHFLYVTLLEECLICIGF